jgi:hypothetical protein
MGGSPFECAPCCPPLTTPLLSTREHPPVFTPFLRLCCHPDRRDRAQRALEGGRKRERERGCLWQRVVTSRVQEGSSRRLNTDPYS